MQVFQDFKMLRSISHTSQKVQLIEVADTGTQASAL